jgi:zinc and cadmium transporter
MNASSQSGPILWIFGFSLLASAGAICLTGSFLLLPPETRQRLVPPLISYAIGTLLGAAFLGLIPHALADVPASNVFAVFLAGIVVFIVLERLMLWRHCHEARCEAHSGSGVLILIGDGVHNFVDGILIAVTFLTSVPLGIATSLAIVSHEVPQEVGDFAILLESGFSAARAFLLNLVSGASTLVGALLAYVWLPHLHSAVPYFMALAAAGFVYVAMADLVPGLHRCASPKQCAAQLILIVAGMGTMGLFHLGNHADLVGS